jgi:hypothetical protein
MDEKNMKTEEGKKGQGMKEDYRRRKALALMIRHIALAMANGTKR